MLCSIDTSGIGRRAWPARSAPSATRSLRSSAVAIGDRVLARRASRGRARPRRSRASPPAPHPRHARAQHRDELRRPWPRAVARNAATGPTWSRWTSIRNMSAHLVGDVDRELAEQVRLHAADAEDEEGAEADGEQDDARLVARPRQVQHGVPERERPRAASGATARTSPSPARCSTTASTAKPAADGEPDFQRRRLPRRQPRRAPPATATSAPICSQSMPVRRADSCRSSSDGFTRRTSSSGTSENSSDTSTPIADPLHRRPSRSASCGSANVERRGAERDRERPRARARPSTTPRRLPARPSSSTCTT